MDGLTTILALKESTGAKPLLQRKMRFFFPKNNPLIKSEKPTD